MKPLSSHEKRNRGAKDSADHHIQSWLGDFMRILVILVELERKEKS